MTGFNRLTFFEPEEPRRISKPFVETYVEENPLEDGDEYEVKTVSRAKTGTGYKVETDEFVVFLRKDTQVLTYLLEALSIWVNEPGSPSLIVVLQKNRPYYRLAVNNDALRDWTVYEGKYTVVDKSTEGSRMAGNPFLNARHSPPSQARAQVTHETYPGQETEEQTRKARRAPYKQP